MAIPAFVDYKRVQWGLSRILDAEALDAAYEKLHEKWAPRMLDAVLRLRGFYLKGGQLVAGNYGNAFPRAWSKVFEPVLDRIPHKPFEQVKAIVERDLEIGDLSELFSSFETEPMAAASIGQVHRATLRHDGRKVVVKVQYPEVEGQFRGDVAISKAFFKVAMPEQAVLLEEVEKQFINEFDYRREAVQLEGVRNNLTKAKVFTHIVVPEPILPLCTKHVLTMTEIPSAEKLTTALERDLEDFAKGRGITVGELIREEERLKAEALARGELRRGPDKATMDKLISARRWRNRIGRWFGWQPVHVPLNHAYLIDELFRVHGHEIFVDGYFNGDPHPGNLLVVRGPDGDLDYLALVDYGQVKVFSDQHRLDLSRLIVALAHADPENPSHRAEVAEIAQQVGLSSKRNDPDVLFKFVQLAFDRDDLLATDGKNIQEYMEMLNTKDPLKAVPDDYVLATRCSLMLRGLGHMLNQHRSGAKMWLEQAEKVLRENGEDPSRFYLSRQ